MKKISLTLCVAAMALASVGCQKQFDDIQPNGTALSLEQVKEGAAVSPDRAQAGLPGMYAYYNSRSVFNMQGDFGYPSMVCRLEHAGDNLTSTTHGYNWFADELTHQSIQRKTDTAPMWAWIAAYKDIKLANDIIASYKSLKDDPNIKPPLGQAYAMRAWNYFFLAQLFGKTYAGNESSPTVVLITEETKPEEYANNPRKTNKEIYDFIIKDLNEATTLLAGYTPGAKNFISEAVAYGIRSRVKMVMHDWAGAAADAKKAIDTFKGAPFTIQECSIPNFDKLATSNDAMWGIVITKDDAVTQSGIANWTSMFTSLCFGNSAYTTAVNTYKMINTRLWEKIPATDVRRDWWAWDTSNGGNSSKLLTNAYSKDDADYVARKLLPFSVVKFAPTDKDLANPLNSNDFMLMRVEEMYYNLAEAKAMGGDLAGGKQVLIDFVKKYRDPAYAPQINSAKELQDEIYFQKRIEFWGEGISWFDMLRMNKGIDRVDPVSGDNGGYPETCRFNIPAGDPTFVFQIPEIEEQSNKAVEGKNNPPATKPKDIM